MTSGKRNVTIVAVLILLLSIGGLHMWVFAPSSKAYKNAKSQYDLQANDLRSMKKANPEALKAYQQETQELVTEISQGIQQLDLEQPVDFVKMDFTEVKLENADPSLTQHEIDVLKIAKADEINAERRENQMRMVREEVEKLRGFIGNRKPQLPFLSNSWGLREELPDYLKTGQLWDIIADIAEEKEILKYSDEASKDQRMRVYQQKLAQVGLNMRAIDGLAAYGDSVTAIHKIAHANLILNRINPDDPVVILSSILERPLLYEWLDIELQVEPVGTLTENELYFIYEQLKALNFLLEVASKNEIEAISQVWLRGYGYLIKQDSLGSPELSSIDPDSWGDDEVENAGLAAGGAEQETTQGRGNMGNAMSEIMAAYASGDFEKAAELEGQMMPGGVPGMPMGMPGMGGTLGGAGGRNVGGRSKEVKAERFSETKAERKDDDIGYALPIKMTFRSSYSNAIRFMYEVMRDKPMAELHRIQFRSLSQVNPQMTDIEVTVTFVFVPKLFDTLDTVREVLGDIQAQAPGQSSSQPAGQPGQPGQQAAAAVQ